MKLTKKLQAEILKIYHIYWDAYLAGDMKTFASMLDDNIKVFGTAVSEVFNNKSETVRFYKATAYQMTGKAEFRNRKIKMNPVDETVLIHEQCDLFVLIKNEWIFYSPVRVSAIFVNTPKGWKLTHQHGSFPDSRAEVGEQIAPEKIKKENLELREAIKRRTIELENKNRELEIDASLEKVRTITMGMRKPDDMLDVCKTISLQLQSLGVKEIRNVQTAIIYASKSIYINYEYYAKHKKQLITEVDFKSHYYQKLFVNKMLKGTGEIFTKTLKGKKVKEWYDHQKTTNQFADRYLGKAKSLSYYWFSLGQLALGISTYFPLSEEQLNLFKRFRNVFELAYQRYLDIEKAESQAREAQIEASLERVRAVAMGMNKSDDLLSICEVSFNEFKKLGIDNIRNALIHIQYDNQKYFMDYDFSDLTGGAITKIEYGSHPVVEDYLKQIRSAKDAFYQGVIEVDQLEEWKDFRRNSGQINDPRLDKATALYYYFFSIGIGDIGISTLKSIDESQIKILKRFRNVFALSYQRYIDISNAEAQAREAQIELALERVRARTMAMQRSAELSETAAVLFNEIKKNTEDELIQLTIGIYNEATGLMEMRVTSWAGGGVQENRAFNLSIEEPTVLKPAFTAWKQKKKSIVIDLSGEQLEGWLKYRNANTGVTVHSSDTKGRRVITVAFFSKGHISLSSPLPISAETIQLLERFATVFDGTYTRFLDLQNAEAQAREARIESALEKIRSRALAMRNSSEVGNVSTLLFLELEKMDINPSGFSIMIFDEEQDKYELWRAKEVANQGAYETFSIKGMFDKFDQYVPGFSEELKSAWTKGNPFFVGEFRGEKRVSFLQANREMANYSDEAFEKMKKGWPDPTFWHLVFFKYGWFGVLQNKQLIKEELLLIHRFAEVFDFAYTRFLDLRKAEAQAREAKIEASLERVRSKTMGMQKSEELKDVIRVVYEQFVHLKINVDHAGFVVDYTPKGDWHFWIADEQDIPSKITHPYFESVWANQFNVAKEKGADFFATKLNFEEKNKFYTELLSYISGLPETSKDFYLSCPGLAATTVLFDNVSLYIENFSGITYTDEENNTLMRFGKVFQQTYTRFLDLQRAEAQNKIIQAENDRKTKELEEARQLQLSMLPKKLPQLPNLDIAVYMKTATEVGGDYYDFNVDGNGTLTFVVGDATGHGMMSGMMVSIMKSFFISNKANIELKQFFENSNNSIKDMQLGRLMMGLIGIQITTEKIIATNAGMPSLLYFRNKSQKAGEFVSNNFPLGAMKGTRYLLKEIKYEKGDILLLMSDGFAELKNQNNELFGYPRIIKEFKSVVNKSSNEIIEHLNNSGTEWANGIESDDDVTFIVIKVK